MEFKISKRALLNALRIISGAVSNKTFVPELTGVLIEAKEDQLSLLTTSQNMSMKYIINSEDGVEIKKPGIVLIKHSFLKDVISKIDVEEILFFMFEENVIEIKAGGFDSKINTLNHDEFPTIRFNKEGNVVNISKSIIQDITHKVAISVAEVQEGTRKILSGVLLKEMGGKLMAAATDTHRLSLLNTGLSVNEGFEIVIPNKIMKEIAKFEEDNFDLYYSKTQIFIKLKKLYFQANIIEDKYPDITRFIQVEPTTKIVLNTKAFYLAADRATALSQQNRSIKMLFTPEKITIRSKAKEIGASEEEITTHDMIGNPLEIATNGNYLCKALHTFNEENVTVNMTGDLKPIIIKSITNKNLIQLILPVRVY